MDDYYNKKQDLAIVDKKDNILGKIDKWEAHEKGILHRAFTVCLFFEDQLILQHRRHTVFDEVYDLTCSSHPYFIDENIQSNEEGALEMLKREWGVNEADVKLEHKGFIYYQAKDPLSKYREHEICHLYVSKISSLPSPVFDFAYGFSLMSREKVMRPNAHIQTSFAPWVLPLLGLLG